MLLRSKGSTTQVKDKDSADRVFEVGRNQTAVALLTCCIPELQSNGEGLVADVFAEKIDTDGGLRWLRFTLSLGSNLLLTYLSMMLVFPVLESPSNTILKVFLVREDADTDMYFYIIRL